ncbi:MAG TPA: SIS domain-containing protein [Acidimicrobiales bacterium]|nr:SIS domain-containing protein [Acidimicrobiales bacterium]
MSAGTEGTDFLYPFIEGDEKDAPSLLDDLATSARNKWVESTALRQRTLEQSEPLIREVAAAMADRFLAGGRLFAFGNGGSATDADGVAQLYTAPPWGTPLPARSLVEDHAVLTALSNDIGFDVVFSRQLIAHGRSGDIAMGFSTSGNSENLLMAFGEARKQGMLTVGLSGYDGGRMAADPAVQHCLVARSQSVHRIQEAQASLVHALWEAVQHALSDAAATVP